MEHHNNSDHELYADAPFEMRARDLVVPVLAVIGLAAICWIAGSPLHGMIVLGVLSAIAAFGIEYVSTRFSVRIDSLGVHCSGRSAFRRFGWTLPWQWIEAVELTRGIAQVRIRWGGGSKAYVLCPRTASRKDRESIYEAIESMWQRRRV